MIQDRRVAALRVWCVAFLVLLASTAPRDAAAQEKVVVPHNLVLVQLVRSTMIALNHANSTGNYSVLRDLGAPSFRNANTSARLAVLFSNIRGKNLELSPLLALSLLSPSILSTVCSVSAIARMTSSASGSPSGRGFG